MNEKHPKFVHYNRHERRRKIIDQSPTMFDKKEGRMLAFVNVSIHPYKFEVIYDNIRNKGELAMYQYTSLKGVLLSLLTQVKRNHASSLVSIDSYIIDFIELIKASKDDDPNKFLMSMKRYMPRFLFIVGLRTAFGLDWKDLVTEALYLKQKPEPNTLHGLFCNHYLRNLLFAYCIWKQYREPFDEEYEQGKNDLLTLLDSYSKLKTALGRDELEALFFCLQKSLPSYNLNVRRRARYMIDTAQDAFHLQFLQFNDPMFKKTQG